LASSQQTWEQRVEKLPEIDNNCIQLLLRWLQ
jgi:hypothetical protein